MVPTNLGRKKQWGELQPHSGQLDTLYLPEASQQGVSAGSLKRCFCPTAALQASRSSPTVCAGHKHLANSILNRLNTKAELNIIYSFSRMWRERLKNPGPGIRRSGSLDLKLSGLDQVNFNHPGCLFPQVKKTSEFVLHNL